MNEIFKVVLKHADVGLVDGITIQLLTEFRLVVGWCLIISINRTMILFVFGLFGCITLTGGFQVSNTVVLREKQAILWKKHRLEAGGFEWEDPGLADSGVENPFKNEALMEESGGDNLKIDPARLLSPRLAGSNLYLVGMMGSGKSAIGSILAKRMGTYTFLDTDDIVEKAAGMPIPEIFAAEGEEEFRNVESQVLDAIHAYVRCVISTGGGIVCQTKNWSKLHSGIVVWLNVPANVIMERIEGTDRPLLQTENPLQTLENLLEDRLDKYQQADMHIEIDGSMDEEEVANTIIRQLHDFLDDNPPGWKLAKQKAQAEGLDWVQ